MLARVKQDYLAGSVTAFSGREYTRSEWREVPPGFEEQAASHPLLETQPSLDDIRAESPLAPGLGNPEPEGEAAVTAVTAETPVEAATEETNPEPQAEEEPSEAPAEETPAEATEPKPARRRRRAAGTED